MGVTTSEKKNKHIAIIKAKGDINVKEMVDIKNTISNLINEDCYNIILDLEETTHINYISLGILIERLNRLKLYDGNMKLVGLSSYLQNIFQTVGADELFDIFPDTDKAEKSFGYPFINKKHKQKITFATNK